MSLLQLNKQILLQYLAPQYKIFLPSWEKLRNEVETSFSTSCSNCAKRSIAWREFLSWYPQNKNAIKELKAIAKADKVEFFNTLTHPPRKIVL